jgi:DNA sulfur modification protein DndB
MADPGIISIPCIQGQSAHRTVLLGFERADLLHSVSFADVLDEDAGRGYQRRFNSQHSLDFRKYVQSPQSATIPLTFNLRPRDDEAWRIKGSKRDVRLEIQTGVRVLAQVDCQHRLGHLADMAVELPFMCFIGLSPREEMEIFNVINSKAKGLSTSLLDFHDAQLCADLAAERPELFIALFLKDDSRSPWYQQLDLGGKSTSGLARRASLRTVQNAVRRFLAKTKILKKRSPEEAARVVLDYWLAVRVVLAEPWAKPRKSFVTKGIGVYALMDTAADIYNDARMPGICDQKYFAGALAEFATDFDWSTEGPLKGLGGESGVKEALRMLREARKSHLRMVG